MTDAVGEHHGQVKYVAEPEALAYRQSREISPDQLVENEAELLEAGVDIEDFEE